MIDHKKSPLAHCWAGVLHSPETNKMRNRVANYGKGTGNDPSLAEAEKKRSPLNQNNSYKKLTSKFPQFNQATDTIITGSSRDPNMASRIAYFNARNAGLSLAGKNTGNVSLFKSPPKAQKTTQNTSTGEYNYYRLYDKNKLKEAATSPLDKKSKVKGGGTSKVCLPAAKVKSMSAAEKKKVIAAKRSAASKDYAKHEYWRI